MNRKFFTIISFFLTMILLFSCEKEKEEPGAEVTIGITDIRSGNTGTHLK